MKLSRPRLLLSIATTVVGIGLLFAAPVCASGDEEAASPDGSPVPAATATPSVQTPSTATVSVATPIEQTPFPTVGFPSPASVSEAMLLGGGVWIDARPASGEVIALIGGIECGRGQSGVLHGGDPPTFLIEIASDAERPGCGTAGASVTIVVNGRVVNETVVWAPGYQQPVNLVAGPPFGNYFGKLQFNGIAPRAVVRAYVDDVLCGEDPTVIARGAGTATYHVVVEPDALRPGCGRDGVVVSLRLTVEGQAEAEIHHVAWDTRPLVELPLLPAPSAALSSPTP